MALKSYKPTTPSQRNLVIVDRTGLYRGKPVKSLVEGQNSTGGRNNHGRITSRFRGGGRAFGPVVRSHEIGLPNKVRALALKHALSAKAKDGGIIILDKASMKDGKTKALAGHFEKLGWTNALIIDGVEVDAGFRNAARNIPNIDVLPIQGINVYDILRRGKLVLTKAAVDALEARFK